MKVSWSDFRAVVAVGILALSLSLVAPTPAQSQFAKPQPGDNPSKAYAIYQKALECFQNGDYANCLKLCNLAVNLDHSNKHIIHLKALALAEAGDNYNAMLMFRSALQMDYNFLPCRNNFGMFLKKTGDLDHAKKMFQECIRIDSRYPDAYYHLGEVLKEQGDIDGAIENFESAVRFNPNYFEAQRDLGLAIFERTQLRQGGDIKDSYDALRKASNLVPDNPVIWYDIGLVDCAEGNLDDAEAMFRNSLMKDPKFAAGHWELARVRYLRGDPDRCILELKQAQKISPLYSESKKYAKVDPIMIDQYLADCYEVKGQYENCLDTLKDLGSMQRQSDAAATNKRAAQVLRDLKSQAHKRGKETFDPQEVQTLIERGINEVEDGSLDAARNSFARAGELNPNSYEALQNLGSVLEAKGDIQGAIQQYQAAMAVKPTFAGAYYNLAYCLEKAGLGSDAGLMYQKFHEIAGRYPYDPKHIVALQQDDARQRARAEQLKKRGY